MAKGSGVGTRVPCALGMPVYGASNSTTCCPLAPSAVQFFFCFACTCENCVRTSAGHRQRPVRGGRGGGRRQVGGQRCAVRLLSRKDPTPQTIATDRSRCLGLQFGPCSPVK